MPNNVIKFIWEHYAGYYNQLLECRFDNCSVDIVEQQKKKGAMLSAKLMLYSGRLKKTGGGPCVREAADKDSTHGSRRVGWRIQQRFKLSYRIILSNVLFTVEECVIQPLMQHRKLLSLACCLLYNKPQSSAFNHVYLVMIID